ncbi:unnamed protein product [Linum trigynum]|uniref:Reverse transcriptase zinc-binding domain-containing protein n=1 Tax=Linum trigynum TaxID=586398 RepID=A0AAV2FN72_9ROSI
MQKLSLLPNDLISAGPAKIMWKPCSRGFSVKSMYNILIQAKFPGDIDFPERVIWQPVVPMKVKAFMWILSYKGILTHDNLMKRGWKLASMCVLCRAAVEDINHLFVHCPFSCRVWNLLLNMVEMGSPLEDDIATIIKGWPVAKPNAWIDRFKSVLLHAFTWEIWKERSARVFRDTSRPMQIIFYKTCRSLASWMAASGVLTEQNRQEWLVRMFQAYPPRQLNDRTLQLEAGES